MITIDLDRKAFENDFSFRSCFQYVIEKLQFMFPDKKIMYRTSSNGGYHIKVMGIPNDYALRELLGDDPQRLELDKIREPEGLPINVLFDQKKYPDGTIKKAGRWEIA